LIHAALIQGVIAKNNMSIPIRIFNCGITKSGVALIIPTLNIINGILNIIIIIPLIEKFLLFKRFIEPEIEAREVKIGEPIKKI
tara:strand:+ start:513 stop:764 length:252 start_codon:yes stop_codon:yes gene_type:complete